MSPAELLGELAAALRDVIQGTPETSLEQDAERVYESLACRLIVRLAPHAAIVPKSAVEPPSNDGYQQMRAASDAITRELSRYRHAGYDTEALAIAVIDVYVRLRRAGSPAVSTASLLRHLAEEAEEMARSEEGTPDDKWH